MFSSSHLFRSHLFSLSVDNFYKKWQQTQKSFHRPAFFNSTFLVPVFPRGAPGRFFYISHQANGHWTLRSTPAFLENKNMQIYTREFLLTAQNCISVIPILELKLLRHLLQTCFFVMQKIIPALSSGVLQRIFREQQGGNFVPHLSFIKWRQEVSGNVEPAIMFTHSLFQPFFPSCFQMRQHLLYPCLTVGQ